MLMKLLTSLQQVLVSNLTVLEVYILLLETVNKRLTEEIRESRF
jgi:hypothetical protein